MNKVMLAMGLLVASTVMVPASAAETEVPLLPADVCLQLGKEQCQAVIDAIADLVRTETTYYVTMGTYDTWIVDCVYHAYTDSSVYVYGFINYVTVGEEDAQGNKEDLTTVFYYGFFANGWPGNVC